MDEVNSGNWSAREEGAAGEWLLPSAALDRFEPPAGMVVAAVEAEKRARYGFSVATLNLLIKPDCASEVLEMTDIWSLPGSVPWLLGLVNLRSNLVPVFDFRRLFDLPPPEAGAVSQILVLDQGDRAAGLLIDDFPEPLYEMSPVPGLAQLPPGLQMHVRGAYMKGEAIWLEFDHASFFEDIARDASQ